MKRILPYSIVLSLCLLLFLPAAGQAGGERLPLDAIKDFDQFIKKYQELSKTEQLRYIALPFTYVMQGIEMDEDFNDIDHSATYTTASEVEKLMDTWIAVLPIIEQERQELDSLVRVPIDRRSFSGTQIDTEQLAFVFDETAWGGTYTFKKVNNAWRLVEYISNESGI